MERLDYCTFFAHSSTSRSWYEHISTKKGKSVEKLYTVLLLLLNENHGLDLN